jgi:hypothetical protein
MAESKGVVKGEADKIIDMHVHVVGNGSGGTGCWIRSSFWRGPMQSFMCRHIGLSEKALKGDLDRLFVEKLLEWVRDSSLDAAVILAHEQVYHEDGPLMKGKGRPMCRTILCWIWRIDMRSFCRPFRFTLRAKMRWRSWVAVSNAGR